MRQSSRPRSSSAGRAQRSTARATATSPWRGPPPPIGSFPPSGDPASVPELVPPGAPARSPRREALQRQWANE
eukprot:2674384-Prymnesium_polylepis.1